jgi:transcription antitermination factor NusG
MQVGDKVQIIEDNAFKGYHGVIKQIYAEDEIAPYRVYLIQYITGTSNIVKGQYREDQFIKII